MKLLRASVLRLLLSVLVSAQPSLTQHVDRFTSTGGHGHTFAGPTMPFGMVQLTRDTRLTGWDGLALVRRLFWPHEVSLSNKLSQSKPSTTLE